MSVLQFKQRARPLEEIWLSAYGFPIARDWTIVGHTIGTTFDLNGIQAKTAIVAKHSSNELCVVTMAEIASTDRAAELARHAALLNAAVVQSVERSTDPIIARVWFKDGRMQDLRATPQTLSESLEQVSHWMLESGISQVGTVQAAQALFQ